MAITGTCYAGPFTTAKEAHEEATAIVSQQPAADLHVELCDDGDWYVFRVDGIYAQPVVNTERLSLWRKLRSFWEKKEE